MRRPPRCNETRQQHGSLARVDKLMAKSPAAAAEVAPDDFLARAAFGFRLRRSSFGTRPARGRPIGRSKFASAHGPLLWTNSVVCSPADSHSASVIIFAGRESNLKSAPATRLRRRATNWAEGVAGGCN